MSPTLEIATTAVNLNEPAFSLRELNQSTPDFKAVHRYQIIRVVRGDSLATYQRDLGMASKYDALQFIIPGGTVDEKTGVATHFDDGEKTKEHTVGKLMEMADRLREDKADDGFPRPDWLDLYHYAKERAKHPHRRVFAKG
jgi:hypothetical protein